MRTVLPIALVLSMFLGLEVLPAGADSLNDAFPAPHWRKEKAAGGIGFECVTAGCGRPAHVAYVVWPVNPKMAENIKSGLINRKWAERLADSYRRSQEDKVTVLNFTVRTGQVPSWSMVYECHCDGRINFISSQTMARAKDTMTFFSLARNPETAQENMNKLIEAALGASSR